MKSYLGDINLLDKYIDAVRAEEVRTYLDEHSKELGMPDWFKNNTQLAEKFLNERISSLKRDVQICIKETLPFPALLYCFATVVLLGSLYKGDATGDTKTHGKEAGTTRKARKYMTEIMKYPEYESTLL